VGGRTGELKNAGNTLDISLQYYHIIIMRLFMKRKRAHPFGDHHKGRPQKKEQTDPHHRKHTLSNIKLLYLGVGELDPFRFF